MAARRVAIVVAALLRAAVASPGDTLPTLLPEHGFVPREHEERLRIPPGKVHRLREDALAHARLWRNPDRPVAEADLRHNPPGPRDLTLGDHAVCKFIVRRTNGTTPKFYCSEPGRVLLAERLGRLRAAQIHDLFEGSGFADAPADDPESNDIVGWVKAFQDKVLEITRRPPCPAA